jgi:glycosyltransferase involved in cell wall biosynthesis
VDLAYLPAPRIKAVESLIHSFLSALHVLSEKADVVFFLDPANAPFVALLRVFGKKVVVHTDGLGWKRRKWGRIARRYYKFVEWACSKAATVLVTDNPAMKEYYLSEYGADSVYIPYGATNRSGLDESVYDSHGLKPQGYMLVVARIEPENNSDFIISEYARAQIDLPLVVVGDSPYGPRYMEDLKTIANERVRFLGRINNQAHLNALYRGAFLYLHGHEVGGTNPSLLRAMDAGAGIVAIDVSFNREVLGTGGLFFRRQEGDLARNLEHLVANPDEVRRAGKMAKSRAETIFRWDSVVEDYEQLFKGLVRV